MKMYQVRSEDIDDRVSWLEAEINEGQRSATVRQIAAEILSQKTPAGEWQVPERDWKGEVGAAFNYVRKHIRYTRDIHGVELFQKADRTLELGVGDCDDISILLGSILGNIGFPLRIRVIATGGEQFHHVYLAAGIPPHDPNEWMALDASRAEGPGWEVSGITKQQDYDVTIF